MKEIEGRRIKKKLDCKKKALVDYLKISLSLANYAYLK